MEDIEKITKLDLYSENFEAKVLAEGRTYSRKIETVKNVRRVDVEEEVKTFMVDGTLESTQTANSGDWVITGPEGEEFVFSDEKLNELYKQQSDGTFMSKERKIVVIKNPSGSKIKINAPWGTEDEPAYQEGGGDCMIAIELNASGEWTTDRYIIGNEDILSGNYTLVE